MLRGWGRGVGVLVLCALAACGSDDDDQHAVGDAGAGLATCAERGGDADEDQVCDADDNCPDEANSTQRDTDGDGEGDACDETPGRCDDRGGDADEDGVCEHQDNCPGEANPDQRDADGDGRGDPCDDSGSSELCAGNGGDPDGDSVCESGDNCRGQANPDQRDADHDGVGDACDRTPAPCDEHGGDRDDDTVCDDRDNCQELANVTQLDRDVDGIGDACDPELPDDKSPGDPCAGIGGDDDDDDWCGVYDNCPAVANHDQTDTDGDELGDACDEEECDGLDNDGDGVSDEELPDADDDGRADCVDPCPTVADGDEDGDGVADCADICPMDPLNDRDRDNVCDGKDNCQLRANFNQSDRDADGIGDACDIEQCDGLSNDLDSLIDEGMSDEDADKVCDEIDSCPGDTQNDLDGDGICYASDSCPDTPNADDVDLDDDGIGDVCDLDARCAAPVPLLTPGSQALPQLSQWADIAVSPDRATLYALTGATAAPYASELLAVDMATKSLKWRMVLGGVPSLIELSTDGSRAWVVLSGARAVRMIDLAGHRQCGELVTWSDTRSLLQPTRLAAVPGQAGSVLVTAGSVTRIYDEGRPRAKAITASAPIAFADAETAYGTTGDTFTSGLYVHTIGAQGFESVKLYPSVIEENISTVRDGRIYTTAGLVVDPSVPRRLADLPTSGPLEVDLEREHIYYVSAPFGSNRIQIDVWSSSTFAYVGSITRSSTSSTSLSTMRRLLRWGPSGLIAMSVPTISGDPSGLWIIDDLDAALSP